MKEFALLVPAFALFLILPKNLTAGGDEHKHHHHPIEVLVPQEKMLGEKTVVRGSEASGVAERLGAIVPGDIILADEKGTRRTLASLIDRPVLLLPVYYHCPQACSMMMASMADAVGGVPHGPGKDYRVLTVSFDHEDDPAFASAVKANYLKRAGGKIGPGDWLFLTGDAPSVRRLTDAVGFRFTKTGPHMFVHPNVLIVLAKDRKIIRYLYGPTFLPFDIGMALTEAERGTPSVSIRKLLSYCFTYEPDKKTYVFTAVRYLAGGILLALGSFLFLVIRRRK